MPNFGTAWNTPSGQDLGSPGVMVSGFQLLAESTLRRWTTGPGELIDDKNYGRNLLNLLSRPLTPAQLAYEQQQAASEAQKDPRIQKCTVKLDLSIAGLLTIDASLSTAAGPFRLVASVSAVTVQLLLVAPG